MSEISKLPVEPSVPAPANTEPPPAQTLPKPVEPTQPQDVGTKLAKKELPPESVQSENNKKPATSRLPPLLSIATLLSLMVSVTYDLPGRFLYSGPRTLATQWDDMETTLRGLKADLLRTVNKMTTREPGPDHAFWSWAKADSQFLEAVGIKITARSEHDARFKDAIPDLKFFYSLQKMLFWCQENREVFIDFLQQPENIKLYPKLKILKIPSEGELELELPRQIMEKYKTLESRGSAFRELKTVLSNLKKLQEVNQ